MSSLDSRGRASDINIEWWDKFYTDMERGLTKYTRPNDWKERAMKAETNHRKPVRNQYEGLTSGKEV